VIKMMILAPRRAGMTQAEFRRYVIEVHGPLVRSVKAVAQDIRHYHTSGNRERVCKQLRDFRLEEYFAVQVCAEDAKHRKPHPAPLKLALAKLNLKPDCCIYVGDAPEDIEMARRARVRVFGVCGPFPTAARVRAANPDEMLRTITDLPKRIKPSPL
jgi:beta-phosphoglucomutase-like phosphatase (HAD superfamily)